VFILVAMFIDQHCIQVPIVISVAHGTKRQKWPINGLCRLMLQERSLQYKTRIKIYGGGRWRSTFRYRTVNLDDTFIVRTCVVWLNWKFRTVRKNATWNNCGRITVTIQTVNWSDWRKSQKVIRIICLWVKIWTQDNLNMKQDSYSLDCNVKYINSHISSQELLKQGMSIEFTVAPPCSLIPMSVVLTICDRPF